MFENILTIIPCRAGSQRYPGKNMAVFNSVPLVVHKIQQAKEAGLTSIVVTTNSVPIKEVVEPESVLILHRTYDLCTAEARFEDVVEDAMLQAVDVGLEFDTVCVLQVTSPTLAVESIVDALNIYQTSACKSLIAVTEAYQPSGGFYIFDKDLFLDNHFVYQEGGGVYILSPHESIDVDYKFQLEIGKCIYNKKVFGHPTECRCL